MSGRNFNGNDVSRQFGAEGQLPRRTDGAVLSHKNRSATGHAFEHAEQASAAAELGMRGHLNRAAHPRQFAGFGNNRFVGLESELEHGHGGTGDAALHKESPE